MKIITHADVISIGKTVLLPEICELYGLEDCEINPINAHGGGRNAAYTCEKEGEAPRIIRIAFLPDRSREERLAEVDFIRYLHKHGAGVANVLSSRNGNLIEEITYNNYVFYACVFERAKGMFLSENGYKYREGVPITEYYYNCGKTLGKLHQLSKEYKPIHKRYSFFDKYNAKYINEIIPHEYALLKSKLCKLLNGLEALGKDSGDFGLVHFDFNGGNYHIDFSNGQITVFDFDNSCYCHYMFDLASLWQVGTGWVQYEQDSGKRRQFMDDYFRIVLEGYKSETAVCDSMLESLPLFLNVNLMEEIVDYFECVRCGHDFNWDEELIYRIKCLECDIPFMGFFHEIYSHEAPFEINMVIQHLDGLEVKLKEPYDLSFISKYGRVFRVFDNQSSGNLCFGVEKAGKRHFLKFAGARTINLHEKINTEDPISVLKHAAQKYKDLKHPLLINLIDTVEIGGGFMLVFDWFDGESCGFPQPEFCAKFKALPVTEKQRVYEGILNFHAHVAGCGYIAVDFNDQSTLYDFNTGNFKLCDIDFYAKGWHMNGYDGIFGDPAIMSPEEKRLCGVVDEVSNVYTMGATAFVLFAEEERSPQKWVLSDRLYEVAKKAVSVPRNKRQQTIREFIKEWKA